MPDSPPLISILIPVYNGARFLRETLESVIHQTYPALDIIAVDDGSTDSSPDILRTFPQIRYFHQPNQGVAQARNHALRQANGRYIALIDQDDLWPREKLETQAAFLEAHPEIAYVIGHERTFLSPGVPPATWMTKQFLEESRPGYLTGTLLARREIFEKVGSFDTGYRTSDDFDWFTRAQDMGVPMRVLPDVALYKRHHQQNLSHETKSLVDERFAILRSQIARHRVSPSA
jgi:glycosyltransferase involved in cell wall biosynthesis